MSDKSDPQASHEVGDERPPRLSFGLPVWNGEATLRRCLDSLLAQDFTDFEIVVSDNASTDGTSRILDEYAARDPRIRVSRNRENIGQIENVNLVFRQSRGEYFRWIGATDWLEPHYASRCIRALEADPGAILVTTYFRIHRGDGSSRYEEYRGERVDSERPERRFARMLWFYHAGDAKYDPIYSMMRRDDLARTRLVWMMDWGDRMMGAELALLGRFQHVPECLAHRTKEAGERHLDYEKLLRRYHPTRYRELPATPSRILGSLLAIIRAAPLTRRQRLHCQWAAFKLFLRRAYHQFREASTRFRRDRLGLNRENLRALFPR
jgi:glycosyltransferase involved in cell wall biosynthesis